MCKLQQLEINQLVRCTFSGSSNKFSMQKASFTLTSIFLTQELRTMLCFKPGSDEKKIIFVTSITLATNFGSEYDPSTLLYKHHNCMVFLYTIYTGMHILDV